MLKNAIFGLIWQKNTVGLSYFSQKTLASLCSTLVLSSSEYSNMRYLCIWLTHTTVCAKKWPKLFLSELHQISTKFDNFWHADSQDDRNMWDIPVLNVHLTQFMSMHYRIKCRCSKLLHYTVNISIRLLIFSLSIWQKAPRDLIILWY